VSRAYSNKALPAGTVLREWRLEEVLGVGGFGIVYKARGIYFNELVAIKEYFPSSISERDSDDTVVPIDSDSEEVHALGLKKFVEEAKLLWNLSTPSRHPNIVSVRSLFEIHGTAYMVMDFEDGVSLSRMLKQGRRFNERSLWNILRPIAEGLDRAHRVGVLHRDIKPPNILINEDNRPVLIDFGSARFEAAEATSTSVTFHTPPYAAIEQYVKTYEQGPWTDVYALGVVMYECITGEKPPEVLERLHAGLGKPLASGKWPGYSKKFLAAVDAAMTVKPDERPQAIADWLAMFGKMADTGVDDVDGDDEATRFFSTEVEAEAIKPVPPAPDADPKAALETGVPDDPKEAKFRRVGQETGAGKKAAAAKEPEPADAGKSDAPAAAKAAGAAVAASAVPDRGRKAAETASPAATDAKKKPSPALLAAGAVGALLVIGGGAYMMKGGGSQSGPGTEQAAGNVPATDVTITDNGATADAANLAAVADETATNEAAVQPAAAAGDDEAVRREAAKAAAAEARLAAIEKQQKRTAASEAKAAAALTKSNKTTAKTAAAAAPAEAAEAGVSRAKLSQFYSIVDDARAMAKQVMRSKNSQNAALARNYDANLRTLRDSIRGIQSDKEADRLIKQASQTRAYVQFLAQQK